MFLVSAEVGPFKSINEPQKVDIEEDVTVFVGMNEAGKTVFLKALEKSYDILSTAKFDPIEDYPRKDLPSYLREHKRNPAIAASLAYRLTNEEIAGLNDEFDTNLESGFTFSVSPKYDNGRTINMSINERPVIDSLIARSQLSSDALGALENAKSI